MAEVEYVNLGDVCVRNTYRQVGASDLAALNLGEGNVKLLPSSQKYDWWTTEEKAGNLICEGEVITLGRARYANLKYYKGKFVSSNNHIVTSADEERVLTRFLYHFIEQHVSDFYIETSTYPKFDSACFDMLEIPLPPVEKQREIVDALDKFTTLTASLTAEKELRVKQYHYYRRLLLTFKQDAEADSIKWVSLNEAFIIKNGYTPSKSNAAFWTEGTIPWFRMEDIRENGRILSDSIQHITPQAVKGSLFPKDSVIIATSATIGEHALITVDSLANQRFSYFSLKEKYKNNIDMKFFFYYCFIIDKWCLNNVNAGNFASVDMSRLKELKIPLPSLAEQKRIVAILDKFDSYVNDITCGLPAEIAARQRQYEYYRNKLLSFGERE